MKKLTTWRVLGGIAVSITLTMFFAGAAWTLIAKHPVEGGTLAALGFFFLMWSLLNLALWNALVTSDF